MQIVTISGTSRPDNYTSKALDVVNAELRKNNIEPVVFDARDLSLSFPGQTPSEDSRKLIESVTDAAGVVLATPEYHGTFSAVTKLIIENLGFPSALAGKPIALLGVAAGRIGAIKSLEQLKNVCSHVGALVVPGPVSIAGVQKAFDKDGHCLDEGTANALKGVAHALMHFLKDFVCPKYTLEAMIRGDGEPWSSTT